MNISAESYDTINYMQLNDAHELIDEIIKDNNEKHFPIILDIGSGNGSVTVHLDKRLKPKSIVAIDLDPVMVQFAKEHRSSPTIEYIVQNFGIPLDNFDERIQNLSGKVSLIFSNIVLHWVEDHMTAAKTIAKLLTNGGRFYANIHIQWDIYDGMSQKEREKHELVLKIPSESEQIEGWRKALEDAGMVIHGIRRIPRSFIGTKEVIDNVLKPMCVNLFKRYIIDKNRRNEIMDNGYNEIVNKGVDNVSKIVSDEGSDGKQRLEVSYTQYRISAQKK